MEDLWNVLLTNRFEFFCSLLGAEALSSYDFSFVINNFWMQHFDIRIILSFYYTVMKNFGFLHPKHLVLKNQPKLPIIQRKFRLKPTKHSSQSQEARSFVFVENYKFYPKFRFFSTEFFGCCSMMTWHLTSSKFEIFSLKSVGRLVHWSPASTLSLKILGSNPHSSKKTKKNLSSTRRAENRMNFFTDSIRNQHPKLRVMNFARNFSGTKKSGLTKTSETQTEVSVERKPENFTKFRAKMNYCVHHLAILEKIKLAIYHPQIG
jgi:hypothetical protein